MVNDSKALRPPSALGTCAALACLLVTAAPAAAGAPGPDPSPAPAPDPYTAPAHPRVGAPASHQIVRTPVPGRPQVTVRPTTTARTSTQARVARRSKVAATHTSAQQPRTIRTGPVRSFSDGLAAAVATTTHRFSRTLALAVALLVLLSGAFVLTAAREIER